MDPITAATLTALASSVAGEAGRQTWQGLSALVRRPFRRGGADEQEELPGISSGEVELVALEAVPADPGRAQALATALGVRAALDPEFRVLLDEWWTQAAADSAGSVHNTISGGTHNGTVVQGRDFSNLTFNMPATPYGDRS
ncbi:hypothetical protein [Streptomyces sp. NRRL WC-3742]|uniref:hypothetical protein n=1 Tax=Streptomyces sp. NRRL WC-3742 TaxID=1463934 RepID=UPI0004CB25D3|nr:hypothetical protein [Streptomyces sp. NRRL WC-3742]